MLVKQCSKFSKPGFSNTWTVNFQIFKLVLEKAEEPEINCQHLLDHQKSKRAPEVYFYFVEFHGYSPWGLKDLDTTEWLTVSLSLTLCLASMKVKGKGQNTGVGSLSLLQGIFPTQGLNPGLPHWRWIVYQLSHKRSPGIYEPLLKSYQLLIWLWFLSENENMRSNDS